MPPSLQRLIEHLGDLQVMLISVLVHLIIILIFAFTVLNYVSAEPPDFSGGESGFVEAVPISKPAEDVSAAVPAPAQQDFSAAAPQALSALSVIVAPQAQAAFTMPAVAVSGPSSAAVADMAVAMRGAMRGAGSLSSGGGAGRSSGGSGSGSGGSGFGSLQADDSKLSGIMYDLKQTRSRKPTGKIAYYEVISAFIESQFNPDVLKGFFRSNPIYTSHIFLPNMDAERGPEAFGLERKIAPSNWFIHYQGAFSPPHAGRFRFWAMADDTLVAVVDGKVVIDVSLDKSNPGKWAAKAQNFRSGYEFTPGDWMELQAEKTYRLDLVVGERPGGKFKAYLLVEREGEKDSKGDPVRRLFSTLPLSGIPGNPDLVPVAPEPQVMAPGRSLRHLGSGGTL